LREEESHPVPPLAVPEAGAAVTDGAAVTLFCERARAHDREFEGPDAAVVEICRRVDGLPLAIELAAARCSLLSPVEIADRLRAALGALGTGACDVPARQRTLRATIDWSHDLLDDDEKACFARFAVFAGGATVDAAEVVTGAGLDTLDRLAAKSLLVARRQPDGRTRLTMLDMIREYAEERFAAVPDAEATRARHFAHFLALAERSATEQSLWGADRMGHLAWLDADLENLHAALGWAVAAADAGRALALAAALSRYWEMRDRYADAVRWIERALALPGAEAYPRLRVRVLCTKARSVFPLGRRAEQSDILREADEIAETMDDPAQRCDVLHARATNMAGDPHELELADEALYWARTAEDDWRLGLAEHTRAMAARSPADLRERVDHAEMRLASAGNLYFAADLLASATYAALCQNSDADAVEFARRATRRTRGMDYPFLWMLLTGNVGLVALVTGDTGAARDAFRKELELCRELAALPFAGEGLNGLAAVATVEGDLEVAAWLCGAAETHRYGQPRDGVDERLLGTYFEPARERLGADAWDAAARRGEATSFEDAIAAALDERSPDGLAGTAR
jgi:hypothetical protein